MKVSKKVLAVSVGVSLALAGLAQAVKDAIPEEQLGYRNQTLYDEKPVNPPKVEYPKAPPGASKRFARAYENAPPQIPHSVEGLVPIKPGNNACLSCHMPENAKAVGATPMSKTHYALDLFTKGGNKKKLKIDPARYQCVMCHTPQANAKPVVKNLFKPYFRDPQAKQKSILYQKWNEVPEYK